MSVLVIAEAGVNHNGSERLALELVDVAADCGADAVKFQTFSADKLVRRGTATAEYQQRATGALDQHAMLASLEMSEAMHQAVQQRCQERGLEFMSTAFDAEAADYLVAIGIRRIKIPSGELTNLPFIRHLASKNLPLIMSTGMATLDEVVEAVDVVRGERSRHDFAEPLEAVLTILHCTSNYPASLDDVNLRAMDTIASRTGLAVGYSDHTAGWSVAVAAAARGAAVIEKHFTTDRGLPGPDHAASLEPGELADMIQRIRDVERALGSASKRPTHAEHAVRQLVRRSVTLTRSMPAGTVVGQDDLALLRPGDGIAPRDIDAVIGRRTSRALGAGSTLQWSDLA